MGSTVDVRALIRIFWLPLLVVFVIGQLEIVYIFMTPTPSDIFLKVAQAIWMLIILVSVYYAVKKKGIDLKQVFLAGFLFFVAFGVASVLVRWLILKHDIASLITRIPALSFLYVFISVFIGALAAFIEKKMQKAS